MKKVKKETKTAQKDWKNMLANLESKINVYFGEKAPKLPEGVAKFIVKYGPYLIILGLITGLLAILTSFGIFSTFMPMNAYGYAYGYHFSFWSILSLIVLVLEAMAIPGLLKRTKSGWNLMFYASLVTALSALLSFSLGSLIIGTAISWYFLFQIRKYYK